MGCCGSSNVKEVVAKEEQKGEPIQGEPIQPPEPTPDTPKDDPAAAAPAGTPAAAPNAEEPVVTPTVAPDVDAPPAETDIPAVDAPPAEVAPVPLDVADVTEAPPVLMSTLPDADEPPEDLKEAKGDTGEDLIAPAKDSTKDSPPVEIQFHVPADTNYCCGKTGSSGGGARVSFTLLHIPEPSAAHCTQRCLWRAGDGCWPSRRQLRGQIRG
mmetsp:Transcript_55533/g.127577  ORF Transcript_55533/g.127577 Transcript_55533/m.127577 type:complete len:212 (-) Transcript_55533:570-1205(-)